MRIGIDATAAIEEQAGIGRFTRELLRALLQEQADHQYVLLGPRGAARPEWAPESVTWATLPISARVAAILWHRAKLSVSVERFTGPLDIFHATDYLLPPLGHAQGIVTVHDLSFLRCPQYAEPRLARYLTANLPHHLDRASSVLADSEQTRQDLIELLGLPGDKVAVVYGGVSADFRPISDPQKVHNVRADYDLPERFLLTVARLEPRKNVLGLLHAYRVLLGRGATPPPLLVGGAEGWMYQPIFDAVDTLELGDHVRFLGHIPDDDLPALLSLATLFVFPSFYEGFGLPPLEAMACGTPVVASDASCLPEVLGDAARYASPDDPAALADQITEVLSQPELADELRQRGLARARPFTWQAATQQLLAAYQRLDRAPAKTAV